MKKVIMISLVFLSLLFQGCDNKQKEIKQEEIKQDIVFIYNNYTFDGFQNYVYAITKTGNVVKMDLSKESYEYLEPDKLYGYIMDNIDETSGKPLMKEEDLYKCYEYLCEIHPDAEIESESLEIVDGGDTVLYGVQLSEEGKAKIIPIYMSGNHDGENTDKNAKKIVDIFDEKNYYFKLD